MRKKKNPAVIRCVECKHYQEDVFRHIEGIPVPVIVAHHICQYWGNGCKTIPEGYCHAGEKKED